MAKKSETALGGVAPPLVGNRTLLVATVAMTSAVIFSAWMVVGEGPYPWDEPQAVRENPKRSPKTDLGFNRLRLRVSDVGIIVEPPGSKAAAYTDLVGDAYGWFLWQYNSEGIKPAKFDTSDSVGPQRIEFEVLPQSTYAISLIVAVGGAFQTHKTVWEPEPGPEPPGPDPPDPGPNLEGIGKLSHDWAMEMGTEARAQAEKVGKNMLEVGLLISQGQYKAGSHWAVQTQAALSDLQRKNGTTHADWRAWEDKWGAEMQRLLAVRWGDKLDERLSPSGNDAVAKTVGELAIESGNGLLRVR